MKWIVIILTNVMLVYFCRVYPLTRAEIILANSRKNQIEMLVEAKPAGWQAKAQQLVTELENSPIAKGLDSQDLSILKKEVSFGVVFSPEQKAKGVESLSSIGSTQTVDNRDAIIQDLRAQVAQLSSGTRAAPETVDNKDAVIAELRAQNRQLSSQLGQVSSGVPVSAPAANIVTPSIDKNAVAEKLDAQLRLSVSKDWYAKTDNLVFDLAAADRSMARDYLTKIYALVGTGNPATPVEVVTVPGGALASDIKRGTPPPLPRAGGTPPPPPSAGGAMPKTGGPPPPPGVMPGAMPRAGGPPPPPPGGPMSKAGGPPPPPGPMGKKAPGAAAQPGAPAKPAVPEKPKEVSWTTAKLKALSDEEVKKLFEEHLAKLESDPKNWNQMVENRQEVKTAYSTKVMIVRGAPQPGWTNITETFKKAIVDKGVMSKAEVEAKIADQIAKVRAKTLASVPKAAEKSVGTLSEEETKALTEKLIAKIKKNDSVLTDDQAQELAKQQLPKATEEFVELKKKEQEAKEVIQKISVLLAVPKAEEPGWIVGMKSGIKELYKLDPIKTLEFKEKFLKLLPKEKIPLANEEMVKDFVAHLGKWGQPTQDVWNSLMVPLEKALIEKGVMTYGEIEKRIADHKAAAMKQLVEHLKKWQKPVTEEWIKTLESLKKEIVEKGIMSQSEVEKFIVDYMAKMKAE